LSASGIASLPISALRSGRRLRRPVIRVYRAKSAVALDDGGLAIDGRVIFAVPVHDRGALIGDGAPLFVPIGAGMTGRGTEKEHGRPESHGG